MLMVTGSILFIFSIIPTFITLFATYEKGNRCINETVNCDFDTEILITQIGANVTYFGAVVTLVGFFILITVILLNHKK